MKKGVTICTVLLYFLAGSVYGQQQNPFVSEADDIVEQITGGEKQYSLTRSFVIVEEPEVKTRAIRVRAKNKKGEEENVVVQVPEKDVEQAARLKIEFDVNSATLRPSAYPLLAELGKAIQDQRVVEHNLCIKGHTDSDGEGSYNLELSYARANSVLNYLKGVHNIPDDRLQVFGYGENVPLVPNNSSWNKQMNRRVEVSLNCPDIK